jgi:aminopeptidase N/ABC-type transport system involved in multi-copper enzyme maturation permease subunit
MFRRIAWFEFRYQLGNPVFWVSSAIFFLLSFGATTLESIRIGATTNVHKNSPFAINQVSAVLTIFGIFALVAFVANVVVRDDDTGFGPIIRATRVTKFNYLFGRFTGAFGAALLCLATIQLGVALGSLMPWVDPETLGPFVPVHYLYGFAVVMLPTLALTGALFFAVATATRSMMATYIAVVGFIVAYLTANILWRHPQYEHFAAYADPFGIAAASLATKYWTAAERNTLEPALTGILLANRLIWLSVAGALLVVAYGAFSFRRVGLPPRPAAAPDESTLPRAQNLHAAIALRPARSVAWAQLAARTRMDMAGVFRSPAFFVLLALGLLNSIGALWTAQQYYDDPIYPVTRVMIAQLRGSFLIIPIIIAIYYAGELVWRDRDRRVHEIIDATPVADWMYAVPKTLALFLVLVSTMLASVLTALIVQTIRGYTHYELYHYLAWYIVPESLNLLIISALAIFVQTVAPVKYAGWGIMGLYIVALLVASTIGFDDNLYLVGNAPDVPLSDMNGQGQYWIGRLWFITYWLIFAAALVLLSHYLWRRGTEQRLMPRLRRLPARMAGAGAFTMAALLLAFTATGATIYYNTHILNPFRDARSNDRFLAEYERALIGYLHTPQPKITDVAMTVDLHPRDLMAHTTGSYMVESRTGQPLDHVHVRWWRDLRMNSLSLDGAHEEKRYPEFNYVILALDKPMAPNERRQLRFDTTLQQRGFANTSDIFAPATGRLAYNGTFLNNMLITPELGMDQQDLLQDRTKRRRFGLAPELRMPKLEDESARSRHLLRPDSDWVTADITVSTDADQIPMAPGETVSDVTANGRRTTHFVSGERIHNFFSVQSASYKVARDHAGDVKLAVYYDPAHEANVPRMMAAMKSALDVFPKVFSPYQFKQARILEFPDYAQFAQSFANTIPYSEGIGFIVNQEGPESVDMITFVTAHEMGHQWWGHQVAAAFKQGEAMLTESFAQYSALLVMDRLVGPERVRKFLKYELDAYLRRRGTEALEELPLNRVEDQQYIYYRKGAVAMYFLKEQLGEAVVDRAMQKLIAQYGLKPAPYPDTRDFIRLLRQEAGPGHDQIITDTLEKITLYDVAVKEVQATGRPDGKYDVRLDIDAHKYYADGQGRETEAPLAENFDIGAFAREPGKHGFGKDDVLAFAKRPLHSGRQTITLVTASRPAFAGVDPYNTRITRNSDTVIAAVQ